MQFNSGWPISLTTQSANNDLSSVGANLFSAAKSAVTKIVDTLAKFVGATDTVTQYINGLNGVNSDAGKPAYMGAVSPWFFTHYSPQTFNKNVSIISSTVVPFLHR